jgi:sulfoxide reductase catalytic subunit YedY
MLTKPSADIRYSEITPKSLYLNRRRFLTAVSGAVLAGRELIQPSRRAWAGTKLGNLTKSPFSTTEKENSYQEVTTYNNFWEFGTQKDEPSKNAQNFKTNPWTVSVEGMVGKPRKYSLDEILKAAPLEERIYRHRCVEGWSIVVPWIGYSLNTLLKAAEPTAKAKFVSFESYFSDREMPLARSAGLPFPYMEGLRLDEAMHPLALLCVGMYGETLPPQDGAPVRLVLPWKYGFKSIKSIVKIKLTDKQPVSTWNEANPPMYGWYSNVNPNVDNPRYSQATERRLGEFLRRKTLMFNGYADQVGSLYAGMDLKKYF